MPEDRFIQRIEKKKQLLDRILELYQVEVDADNNSSINERDQIWMIRNVDFFIDNPYPLIYRVKDRDSFVCKVLTEIIGRDIDIIYPHYRNWRNRWYDGDVDRELWGYGFRYLGREEYKQTRNLPEDSKYEYDYSLQESVSRILSRSRHWICGSVNNFSSEDNISRGYNDGKGVVLYKFYTNDLQYFSIINFTGCDVDNIDVNTLSEVGEVIQPWASELMNFIVEAWVRRKYADALSHLRQGIDSGEFSFTKPLDEYMVDNIDELEQRIHRQFILESIMDEIMEIVCFDNILENPDRYIEFVEGIREGELLLESCSQLERVAAS
jgi:hypothetical protein